MASLARESDLTTVIVTHHIAEAVRMGQRILVVRKGVNRQAHIVTNDGCGDVSRQNPTAFNRQCEKIRALLGEPR